MFDCEAIVLVRPVCGGLYMCFRLFLIETSIGDLAESKAMEGDADAILNATEFIAAGDLALECCMAFRTRC